MFSILSIIISSLICNSSYFFNDDLTVSISNSTHEYNISSIFDQYCKAQVEEYNPLYDNYDTEFEIAVNNNYSVENITYDDDNEEVEIDVEIMVEEEVEVEVEQIINTTE